MKIGRNSMVSPLDLGALRPPVSATLLKPSGAAATSADAAVAHPPPSKKLAEAAKQFEALMITQMMKSARDDGDSGWLSDGDQTGEDSSTSLAEEQFAQSLASNGGLGLANMVIKTMSSAVDKSSVTPDASTPVTLKPLSSALAGSNH